MTAKKMLLRFATIGFVVAILIFSLTPVAAQPSYQVSQFHVMTLDGVRDSAFCSSLATDPSGDLSNPGPAEWSGTHWADLTNIYIDHDAHFLYVYVDSAAYQQSGTSGEIGLLIDVSNTPTGGSSDPWGNAITFSHTNKPDYLVRGLIPGQYDGSNGYTELLTWNTTTSAWDGAGTNWGGISFGGQVGTNVAYANGQGIEFKILLSSLGLSSPDGVLNLEFFGTQSPDSKGAYDTVPSDDQSVGWDDATDLNDYASFTLGIALDGQRDPVYCGAVGTDPAGDLASPGPADWSGVAWTDQTAIYAANDSSNIYVYVAFPNYNQSGSSGQIGLLIDVGSTPAGGSNDPWGNAITFNHSNKPDYVIRGNIAGMSGDDNGWTELRSWSGADFNTGGGVNWGGISGGQVGTHVVYANNQGVEFKIPLSDLGLSSLNTTVNLEFFGTQGGGSKGAYDTVPSDDQSTGWDDATTLSAYASYTLVNSGDAPTPTPTPEPGAVGDCNIQWNQVLHDTFGTDYRSIVGPTTPGNTIRLRLRTAQGDLTSARVRLWNDRLNAETYYNLAWDGTFDTDPVTYDWWFADIPVGADPTVLYYFFELNDNNSGGFPCDQDFYVDDDTKFYGGGFGQVSDFYNDSKSFQITVYDPAFTVPTWMQQGIVYQIFPDRFRDGNSANDPAAGRFFYDEAGGAVVRSNQSNWNSFICDPRSVGTPTCANIYSDNFYGGDLAGITEKINAGYFDNLGVTVLYLNPIFRSPSNHKYDTADYLTIDPDFGTLADFQALVAAADSHGMRIILDGVFNHTSSDSTYFDYYHRYDAAGNLVSPNVGTDDDSGACESAGSPYYDWFYFPAFGSSGGTCANGVADALQTYEAWFGYGSLPKLNSSNAEVRDLIWADGLNSVGPYWTNEGASGWRFDVGGDVDPGLTNDPANGYWEGFRAAVRAVDPDTVTLGEEWGDATGWLLGNEWDSVMNYRFRSAVLSWLFTGCSGNGCNAGVFEDNDSNNGSSSGPISYISPSQFNARLRSIEEDYPPMAFKAMMNLEGSHDTNRLRFLLKKINNDNDSAAVQRMKEWWLFSFTYAGAPTLYYGDEVGLNQDGLFSGGKYEDDPYNRAPFPWDDTPGDFTADTANLLAHARTMASIRLSYTALQDGDVQHGLIIDDANKLYGFARTNATQTALIALNRDNAGHPATFNSLNAAPYNLPDGTVLLDALSGNVYTVSGGSVSLTVNSSWGVVLLEQAEIDTPNAAAPALNYSGNDVIINWPSVSIDATSGRELPTYYEVYRNSSSGFTPDPSTLLATVTPPDFGSPNGTVSYTDANAVGQAYYYIVLACNAAGNCSQSSEVQTAVPGYGSTPAPSTTINVGTAVVGQSVSTTLTVSETGNAQLNVTGATLTGPNASNFSLTTGAPPFSIPDGSPAHTVTIRCLSTSVGSKSATLALSHNAAGSPATYPLTCLVNKANTTTTITSDLPDPSSAGQVVTVQYTVAVSAPGAGTPTGNVTVSDGVSSCSASVAAGSCSLTFTTSGARTLTATYAGNANFTGSSDTETHQVSSSAKIFVWRAGQWRNYDYATGTYQPATSVTTGAPGNKMNIPVWFDYDGDGTKDFTVFTNKGWKIYDDNGTLLRTLVTNYQSGDLPAPLDYDGDGDEDAVFFRPHPTNRSGTWHKFNVNTGAYLGSVSTTGFPAGTSLTIPVPGNYDGDADDDFAVYTNKGWLFYSSTGGTWVKKIYGWPYREDDLPVPADYDGDGDDDVVIWRYSPISDGALWFWFDYATGAFNLGKTVWTGDLHPHTTVQLPAPIDFNGDGAVDRTVFTNRGWQFYSGGTLVKTINTGYRSGDLPLSERLLP